MRAPVEVLLGTAGEAVAGVEGDFAMLDRGISATRTWICAQPAVVLGVSRELEAEVDEAACAERSVAVLRRASGGGTVVIGPGTLQYAIALPHRAGEEPPSIDAVKRFCNRLVGESLAAAGVTAAIDSDVTGDLRMAGRKVGGLALRRRRNATLLHGTLLVAADLGLIAAVLRHPAREPEWRRGRPHLEFLANLGHFDEDAFARALEHTLRVSPSFPAADGRAMDREPR